MTELGAESKNSGSERVRCPYCVRQVYPENLFPADNYAHCALCSTGFRPVPIWTGKEDEALLAKPPHGFRLFHADDGFALELSQRSWLGCLILPLSLLSLCLACLILLTQVAPQVFPPSVGLPGRVRILVTMVSGLSGLVLLAVGLRQLFGKIRIRLGKDGSGLLKMGVGLISRRVSFDWGRTSEVRLIWSRNIDRSTGAVKVEPSIALVGAASVVLPIPLPLDHLRLVFLVLTKQCRKKAGLSENGRGWSGPPAPETLP